MSLDSESTLTREEVTDRIEELEESATPSYVVYRVKNGDELDTFRDEDTAREFITDEDYDPERVKVREDAGDEDDAQELEELREFDQEALNDIESWDEGVVLYQDDYIDDDFARERAESDGPRGVDFDSWPYSLIDWGEAANQLKEDADGQYATLNGIRFYYL